MTKNAKLFKTQTPLQSLTHVPSLFWGYPYHLINHSFLNDYIHIMPFSLIISHMYVFALLEDYKLLLKEKRLSYKDSFLTPLCCKHSKYIINIWWFLFVNKCQMGNCNHNNWDCFVLLLFVVKENPQGKSVFKEEQSR